MENRSNLHYHEIRNNYSSIPLGFCYFPEHENEESIVRVKNSWSTLLEEFYHSSWHTSLTKDPLFIQTFQSNAEARISWANKQQAQQDS